MIEASLVIIASIMAGVTMNHFWGQKKRRICYIVISKTAWKRLSASAEERGMKLSHYYSTVLEERGRMDVKPKEQLQPK